MTTTPGITSYWKTIWRNTPDLSWFCARSIVADRVIIRGRISGINRGCSKSAADVTKDDSISENYSITEYDSISENNSVTKNDPITKNNPIAKDDSVAKDNSVSDRDTARLELAFA